MAGRRCHSLGSMTANPPRWHADPTRRHELRYWNGTAWTEHVSDRGVAGVDRLDGGGHAGTSAADVTGDAHLMPSSEGRSVPARHDPVPAELATPPTRTQAVRPEVTDSRQSPRPIVTSAGMSGRVKLLIAFVALDLAVAAVVIWFVTR